MISDSHYLFNTDDGVNRKLHDRAYVRRTFMFVICGILGGIMVVTAAVCLTSRRLLQSQNTSKPIKQGRPSRTKSSDEKTELLDFQPPSAQLDSIEEHPEEGTNIEGTLSITLENLKPRQSGRIMTEMERKRFVNTPKVKDKDDTALLMYRQRRHSPAHNSI